MSFNLLKFLKSLASFSALRVDPKHLLEGRGRLVVLLNCFVNAAEAQVSVYVRVIQLNRLLVVLYGLLELPEIIVS